MVPGHASAHALVGCAALTQLGAKLPACLRDKHRLPARQPSARKPVLKPSALQVPDNACTGLLPELLKETFLAGALYREFREFMRILTNFLGKTHRNPS